MLKSEAPTELMGYINQALPLYCYIFFFYFNRFWKVAYVYIVVVLPEMVAGRSTLNLR